MQSESLQSQQHLFGPFARPEDLQALARVARLATPKVGDEPSSLATRLLPALKAIDEMHSSTLGKMNLGKGVQPADPLGGSKKRRRRKKKPVASSMVAKNERASTKKQRSSDIIRDTSEPEFLAEMQKVGKGKDALILAELLLWLRILFQLPFFSAKMRNFVLGSVFSSTDPYMAIKALFRDNLKRPKGLVYTKRTAAPPSQGELTEAVADDAAATAAAAAAAASAGPSAATLAASGVLAGMWSLEDDGLDGLDDLDLD